MPKLILASSSPRRSQLMQSAGYEFEVILPHDAAESPPEQPLPAPEFAMLMAQQKAIDVWRTLQETNTDAFTSDAVIIGCDTVVECKNRILGKPADVHDAQQMLRSLRGTRHHVYSGLCLVDLATGKSAVEFDRATLVMENVSEAQLAEYLESGLWHGKAGGFGYQDRQGWLQLVDGEEANVVGLPLRLLAKMLATSKFR